MAFLHSYRLKRLTWRFHRFRSYISVQVAEKALKRHETPYFAPNWRPGCHSNEPGNLGGLQACDKAWCYRTESQNMAFLHLYRFSSTTWRFRRVRCYITVEIAKIALAYRFNGLFKITNYTINQMILLLIKYQYEYHCEHVG